jgi:hypothetical protein
MVRIGQQPPRHVFILNPYPEERFAFCPKCEGPTEQRKFPLVVHVDPRNPVSLNKTCSYCPRCDLIIAHQDELEAQLAYMFQERSPELIGNNYLVIGTLDPEVWERGRQTPLTISEMMAQLHDFKEVRRVEPAGTQVRYRGTPHQKRPRRAKPASGRRPGPSVEPPAPSAERQPGRNDPCWCGSGKKYKNCHLRQDTKGNSTA